MLFLIILTFLLTTAFYAVLLWLAVRRVLRRVQGDETAVKAITQFVLIPLLGRSLENGEVPAGNAETSYGVEGGPDGSPYGSAPQNGQTASRRGSHEAFG